MSIQTEEALEVRPAQATGGTRAVSFEAEDLETLGRQVAGWLIEHPSAKLLAFSHAAESRQVVPFPARLSGPVATTFYTGILLVEA